jgi:hypothetical protein
MQNQQANNFAQDMGRIVHPSIGSGTQWGQHGYQGASGELNLAKPPQNASGTVRPNAQITNTTSTDK